MTNSATPALPPLPEPADELAEADGFNVIGLAPVFTADQMHSYALQATADLTRQLDKLKHEVERISADAAELGRAYLESETKVAAATRERDEARAEVERLRVDAERYRALRMWGWFDGPLCVVRNPKQAIYLGADCPSRERLDALIDAAQAAPAQKELT